MRKLTRRGDEGKLFFSYKVFQKSGIDSDSHIFTLLPNFFVLLLYIIKQNCGKIKRFGKKILCLQFSHDKADMPSLAR
jgi:hypothetical protein